jgi:hypothetical protein
MADAGRPSHHRGAERQVTRVGAAGVLLLLCLLVPAGTDGQAVDGRTLYGFFPSPPEITRESILATHKALGEHGDLVLIARNVPWKEFASGGRPDSADIKDLAGMVQLSRQNGLEPVFVVDPLNGLDRRRFMALPDGWNASFANPDVRSAMASYALRIVDEFHPRFLALASEINTYQDTHPDDYPSFLTLYREIYARIKAAAPRTRVFVTFQWDELNNLMPGVDGGKPPYEVRWEQVEAFEPRLDVWAISTYPFVAYRSAREIPSTYYSVQAGRTSKPIALAEGGYSSENVGSLRGTPEDQSRFLGAVHDQLGARLQFWIYTVLSDFSLASYAPLLKQQGLGSADVATLGWFAHVGLRRSDGTPKPAMAVWDSYRGR